MSPPMDIHLVRIDSITITSPGPAEFKCGVFWGFFTTGFLGHENLDAPVGTAR